MSGLIFDSFLTDLITFCALIFGICYYFVNKTFSHWKNLGVKYLEPTFPFGNFGKNFKQKLSVGELIQEFYNSTNERFIGIYTGFNAALVINDPELIRHVFIKDFQHFHDRGIDTDEKNDPLGNHLFSMAGEKWKNLRQKLKPVFTTDKLKSMFQTLIDCGEPLRRYMEKAAQRQDTVDIREIAARFTTTIIASTAFGIDANCIDANCIDDPDNDFRKMYHEIPLRTKLNLVILMGFPFLKKLLKVKFTRNEVEKFMMNVVRENLHYRETNNVIRKDFFQLLIQLKNTGIIQDNDNSWESKSSKDNSGGKQALTFNELAAQAWVFYVAGFETSSTVMSFCLYEMAANPECQRKVQQEIDEVLGKHNNEITYDSVGELKYLECCIDETLRKWPPLPILQRSITKEYKIPDTNIILEKGTGIILPVLGLQRDPKYYPEPEKFDPDRWTIEKSFVEMPYMPFGDGQRSCIGLHMGKLHTKVGLLTMLQKYSYSLVDPSKRELEMIPASFVMCPVGGIHLKVTKR